MPEETRDETTICRFRNVLPERKKAARRRPLADQEKLINKLISKKCYIVEQNFEALKRLFKFSRASCLIKLKAAVKLWLKTIAINLLTALNKMVNRPSTA